MSDWVAFGVYLLLLATVVIVPLTLTYQQKLLRLLLPPSLAPRNAAVAANEQLANELKPYTGVEMVNGVFKGAYTYKSGYLYMRDVKIFLLDGQWVSRGEIGEFMTSSRVMLRFTQPSRAARKSIFDQR